MQSDVACGVEPLCGVDEFAGFEDTFDAEQLDAILDALSLRNVALTLPKFTCEAEFSLADTLAGMGMPDAFQPGVADFSGINGRRDLFLMKVLHKAFVEVNEEGTEAAAATGIVAGVTSVMPGEPFRFRADHPFLFLIRDRRSGAVLFMGRVADPTK